MNTINDDVVKVIVERRRQVSDEVRVSEVHDVSRDVVVEGEVSVVAVMSDVLFNSYVSSEIIPNWQSVDCHDDHSNYTVVN